MRTYDHQLHKNSKIAFLFSAGMDSTIMLYMLLKQLPESGSTLDIYTCAKTDGSVIYVSPLLRKIALKLDIPIHSLRSTLIGDGRMRHDLIVSTAVANLLPHYDYVYLATNPTEIIEADNIMIPVRKFSKNPKIVDSFETFSKTEILDLYIQHSAVDLLPYTHTCTEVQIGRCDVCYQCRERALAFSKLQLTDTLA